MSDIKVTISPSSNFVGRVGVPVQPKINEIAYGTRTLKSASDLQYVGAKTGDAIVYDAETNSFVTSNFAAIESIDGGSY